MTPCETKDLIHFKILKIHRVQQCNSLGCQLVQGKPQQTKENQYSSTHQDIIDSIYIY